MSEKTRGTVSEKDREYMRRLGAIQDELNAEELAEHLALPSAERLRRSMELSVWGRAALGPDDDDPGPIYQRARELGLYRG